MQLHATPKRRARIQGMLAGMLLACAPGGAPQAQEPITLNMRNADINSVLEWVAETSGRRVVVDPRVRGTVTILARDPMPPAEALQVVIAAINVYGYTAIEQGEMLQVVPAANLKSGATQLLRNLGDTHLDVPVNEVLRLANLPAAQVADTLRPLLPAHASLIALPGSNSLLVTDVASSVERVARLARELDRNAVLELDVVPLRHATAEQIEPVLKELMGGGEAALLQVAVDQRANALLLAGSAGLRARARELVARLDQPAVVEGSLQVVYLHYLDAGEMVGVLRGMIDKEAPGQARRAAVAIEAAESANALVISATPDRMEQMLEVIRKLDIRRAQVLVEAIIAEVGEGTAQQLGVEWKTSFDGEGVEAIQRLDDAIVDVADNPLQTVGRGLTLGYFRNGSLRALLRALATDTDTNILSTPSVVTLDNQEAEILVGSNVPFKTGESTSQGAPVENPFTTIERQDIGVTLKVTPQVNEGDAITLDILQQIETLTDADVAEDLITDKRSIRTSVMLGDDDILVLGGLQQDQKTRNVRKVPVLGDLPVLGVLFRSSSDEITRRNLMVFVRTRILTDLADAEAETRERYNRVREAQQDFNAPARPALTRPEAPVLPALD